MKHQSTFYKITFPKNRLLILVSQHKKSINVSC